MTFEDEKLTLALNTLKETERRCTSHRSWLQTIKSKVFGAESAETVAQYLESQIILADSLVFLSTLTFLQNDISGYFKGGWLLRKSWKLYQHVYTEISKVYKDVFGPLNLPGKNIDLKYIFSLKLFIIPRATTESRSNRFVYIRGNGQQHS